MTAISGSARRARRPRSRISRRVARASARLRARRAPTQRAVLSLARAFFREPAHRLGLFGRNPAPVLRMILGHGGLTIRAGPGASRRSAARGVRLRSGGRRALRSLAPATVRLHPREARTSSLSAFPSARPWARVVASFMTRPKSLDDVAPTSRITSSTSARVSSRVRGAGRYS